MENLESRNNADNVTSDSILDLNEINDVLDVTRDSKIISFDDGGGARNSFLGDISMPSFNSQNLSNISRPRTDDEVSNSSDVRPHFSGDHRPNNQNDLNSERINTDLNNVSGITRFSFSSSYISNRTMENLNNSMRYCQKLLELIEKRTQLMKNMSFASSEQLSDIMEPAGMNISYSNVSSSSLNDNATNRSGQLNENQAGIRELHTSRQSIHEEGNTSVRQTTGKLISIDSSHGLSNLSDLNTSRQNRNIPTTNAQNISVHQTTGKLISIDSSHGLSSLSNLNTSRPNQNIPTSNAQNISVHQTTGKLISIDSSLGLLELSGDDSDKLRSSDVSDSPKGIASKYLRPSEFSDSPQGIASKYLRPSEFSDSPQGIASKYLRPSEFSDSPQGIASKYLRPSEISHNSTWASSQKNFSQFSFLDDSEINMFKLIEDISHISMVDMPKVGSIKCDNEDKIVIIKNPDFNDWKINITSSGSNVPGPSSAPDFPPLAHERRTICSPSTKGKATYNLQVKGKVSKGTQTDPVTILSMDIDDPQFREPDPPEPIEKEPEKSKIPQMAQEKQVKKSFLPKFKRTAPVKDLNVKTSTPKSSPPKKQPKTKPSKKFDKRK